MIITTERLREMERNVREHGEDDDVLTLIRAELDRRAEKGDVPTARVCAHADQNGRGAHLIPEKPIVLHSEHAPDLVVHYPTRLRDRIGMFMLNRGIKMGCNVDPADVQDLLEQWENEIHPGLEYERDQWRKLATESINLKPPPPIFVERDNPQGTPIAYQCMNCGVVRWRQFEACVCGAATWQQPRETWRQMQELRRELDEMEERP